MMEKKFIPGQRWLSESEPELGLGSIVAVNDRQVQLYFSSGDTTRNYACDTAPLRRIRFSVGDAITSQDGRTVTIEKIMDDEGVIIYHGSGCSVPESDLSETMDFSSPEDRLSLGKVDVNSLFNLRFLALEKRTWLETSPVRGLLGARISLIPHQLYIASVVSRRYHARVLLGDEVGLGKTIEAALVLHHQVFTGLCTRALILLPESLAHQWFLELWRRFNLRFSIFDEDRCKAIETGQPNQNPFLDSSWIICCWEFLTENPNRMQQVFSAEWDMLIVDEAHHLSWDPESPSPNYQLVENLAGKIPSVLLLTGTPEQLGEEGHFARLHLLDTERFHDLKQFQKEQKRYASVVGLVEKLLKKRPLADDEKQMLSKIYHYNSKKLKNRLQEIEKGDAKAQQLLITELVDHHGTGRLFYRNQRSNIRGFPKRQVKFYELELNQECAELYSVSGSLSELNSPEFHVPSDLWKKWWLHDLRVGTVLKILEDQPYGKVLLICTRRETVQALQEAIEQRVAIPLAVFHEDLPLIVRDRQAAYFADPDGARLLICSEIGSEGRNFQFCHHLILFDLPKNPELLEQRIGRLDRIGQKNAVNIHVLYLKNTEQEVFARWYHDGLNAFSQPVRGASQLYRELGNSVSRLASLWFMDPNPDQLQKLIDDTQKAKKYATSKLISGRDRLLEWHSHRPDIGNALVDEIDMTESHSGLMSFTEDLCQYLGVHVEDHDHNSLFLKPGDLYRGLPGLPEEGLPITFSRQLALAREDMTFLSWEHPMIVGGMDQLLGSCDGRTSYGLWKDPNNRSILLETIFIVYCLAPRRLRPERFLPPTPLRILVNHSGQDLSNEIGHEHLRALLKDDPHATMLNKPEVTQQLIPPLIRNSRELAELKKPNIIEPALVKMRSTLEPEIDRLNVLLEANAPVREEEISYLQEECHQLDTYFKNAVIRLDAVRFIWRGPEP